MPAAPLRTRQRLLRTAAIAAVLAIGAGGWMYAADRLGPARKARQFIDAIEASGANHAGYRRAHSHGVCASGWFEPSAAAAGLSQAAMLRQPSIPVVARLSVGGGSPVAAEATARVRSLALQLTGEDGQQWRMAMNSFPFFSMPSAQAFLEQVRAQTPDPVTGQTDAAALTALQQRYPSARAFAQWAATAPWTDSWATTAYNSIHAFRFTAADGRETVLRWRFVPVARAQEMSPEQRRMAAPDYLSTELTSRLVDGPVRWEMQLQLAGPGDDPADPSVAWPEQRRWVHAGTLVLDAQQPQRGGPCEAINFDPTVLPDGIVASDDPILAVRSAVYAQSWNRRLRETRAMTATSQEAAP